MRALSRAKESGGTKQPNHGIQEGKKAWRLVDWCRKSTQRGLPGREALASPICMPHTANIMTQTHWMPWSTASCGQSFAWHGLPSVIYPAMRADAELRPSPLVLAAAGSLQPFPPCACRRPAHSHFLELSKTSGCIRRPAARLGRGRRKQLRGGCRWHAPAGSFGRGGVQWAVGVPARIHMRQRVSGGAFDAASGR